MIRGEKERTTIHYTMENNILNFVYDNWDGDRPFKNGEKSFNNKMFWDSANLAFNYIDPGLMYGFYEDIILRDKRYIINKCGLEDVYKNKDKNYYFFIGHASMSVQELLINSNPHIITEDILKCLNECDNFFVGFITEHECDTEENFKFLLDYLKNKNIKEEKIYVLNNNYNLSHYKQKYHSKINVHTLVFIPTSSTVVLYRAGGCDFITEKEGKFFMCFNKSPKPHRYATLCLLKNRKLINDTNWSLVPSWGVNPDSNFYHSLFNTQDMIQLESEILYFNNTKIKKSDYEENKKWFDDDGNIVHEVLPNWMLVPEFKENYKNSYVNIVTESHFKNWGNMIHITEKSFKPFFYYQIPIIFATKGHIRMMKEKYGFDFFDDIINHSYNDESNDRERLIRGTDELCRIYRNKNSIIEFYKSNYERFELNKLRVLDLLKNTDDFNYFKNLI